MVGDEVVGVDLGLGAGLDHDQPVTADFFPAYDDDGGLLVAVTPRQAIAHE